MKRTTWVKPMTLVQKFEANEAVAADPCWRVKCDWSQGWWDDGHWYCQNESDYRFLDENDNGKVDKMQNKHAGIWSDCEFYADEAFTQSLGKNLEEIDIKPGQVIYYNTLYGTNYHHRGTAYVADSSHPNHS